MLPKKYKFEKELIEWASTVLWLFHHHGEVVRSMAEQGHRPLPDGPLRQENFRQQRVQAHDSGTSQQSGTILSTFPGK